MVRVAPNFEPNWDSTLLPSFSTCPKTLSIEQLRFKTPLRRFDSKTVTKVATKEVPKIHLITFPGFDTHNSLLSSAVTSISSYDPDDISTFTSTDSLPSYHSTETLPPPWHGGLPHSCTPNAIVERDSETGEVHIHCFDDNEPSVSYIDPFLSREARRQQLEDRFWISCTCKACSLDDTESWEDDMGRRFVSKVLQSAGEDLKPSEGVKRAEDAIRFLKQSGIKGHFGPLLEYRFDCAVALWPNRADTFKWCWDAREAYLKEKGAQSEETLRMSKYLNDLSSHPEFNTWTDEWDDEESPVIRLSWKEKMRAVPGRTRRYISNLGPRFVLYLVK